MQLLTRRRIALFLIILGLLFLIIGAYFLIKQLWPQTRTPAVSDQPRDVQIVDRQVEPQTYALPTTVQGTSTAPQVLEQRSFSEQDVLLKAEAVVSRMGSGTSQDGFLGYLDVLIDGTPAFRSDIENQRKQMMEQYPASGPLFGITTITASKALSQGKIGDDKLTVKVLSVRYEDAGDRTKPIVSYNQESLVTLLKQTDGSYLVSQVTTKKMD